MHYDFNQVITRHHTNSVKYDCAKYFCPGIPDDFIPMWVADMDFATPDDVKNAMIERHLRRRIRGQGLPHHADAGLVHQGTG